MAFFGAAGNCQELPQEGQFKITCTAVITSPANPIPISTTKDIVMNNLIMTASNDAGSGLLHGLAGHCANRVVIDKAAKTVEYRGSCNYTDRSGDMVFEDFATTAPQPMGPVIAFKGSWQGGTGKYTGLTGEINIKACWRRTALSSPSARRRGPTKSSRSPYAVTISQSLAQRDLDQTIR
jgi:hypothetical protein